MTFAEMEVSLKKLADNQIVQGEMLYRIEQAVARNSEAIARHSEAIVRLADGMQVMQAAMQKFFEHMDRFIRGLEGNGRHRA
ncbi:MAG TPA: hypothetical protein VKV79_06375 [Terriglobia bacterium]|nr:hypothetical protein [Terriglobia bacterium]